MNKKCFYSFLTGLFFCITATHAQDSTHRDSVRHELPRRDSIRPDSTRRRYFDSTLFADDNVLTNSDYLIHIQRVFQTLNKVPVLATAFYKLTDVKLKLEQSNAALAVIRERLTSNEKSLNIRNLQMFRALLQAIDENDKTYMEDLNTYDDKLDKLKKEILDLRKDTAIRHIFRDTALRKTFTVELKELRTKWKATDSLVRFANTNIDALKAIASSNTVNVTELTYQTDFALSKTGPRAFSKEAGYLWERDTVNHRDFSFRDRFRKSANNDNQVVKYYFANTRNKRLWLVLTGIVFFVWVLFNYNSLRKKGRLEAVQKFQFKYLRPLPVAASFIVMLSLAPLFDLDAPAIYIEMCQFLLMLILTAIFKSRWPRNIFYYWCVIVVLFFLLAFTRMAGLPYYVQRWWVLFVNTGAVFFGLFFWVRLRKTPADKTVFFGTALYIIFNFLAVMSNVFGRLTLTQIFGYTSIYAFAQVLSLPVFIRLINEAFLLQIVSSRIRKDYPEEFEVSTISKGIDRLALILAIIIWLITFTTNLNIYNFIYRQLESLFSTQRMIGSITFTFGGIVLFLGIIWMANFLQKYIAYFFGDTGDDTSFDNKGQRSRLMITRLVLLIAGFLLAVAASGLPMDKITVVLGALGVGIGLGLQGIVNNFVSGIILIFDRPLRIGDTVEVGDKKGRVKEISIRSSTLLTPDGAEVIIPNGDLLSHNIVNWTLSNNHIRAEFSIMADSFPDYDDIKKGFVEIIKGNSSVVSQRAPEVLFTYMKGKTVQITFMFWCRDVTVVDVAKSRVTKQIYALLEEKGINIV